PLSTKEESTPNWLILSACKAKTKARSAWDCERDLIISKDREMEDVAQLFRPWKRFIIFQCVQK
ncbi:MAG TPA: hypothetical protein VF610_06265, partial [Segetibacter sp.]